MTISITAIGNYQFIRMSRMPPPPHERIELEARAGTGGVAAWKTGSKGTPYSIDTVVDVANQAAAVTLQQQYAQLVGTGPQLLYYGGNLLAYRGLILSVEPIQAAQTLLNVGGLLGTSYGLCIARWKMISWGA